MCPFSSLASAFVVFRSLPSRTFFMPLCTGVTLLRPRAAVGRHQGVSGPLVTPKAHFWLTWKEGLRPLRGVAHSHSRILTAWKVGVLGSSLSSGGA
jgi:hypothetical protein